MRIMVHTTFLDGRDRFESGEVRSVPDADGKRFIDNGWAAMWSGEEKLVDRPPSRPPVDLKPQGTKHGLEDNYG